MLQDDFQLPTGEGHNSNTPPVGSAAPQPEAKPTGGIFSRLFRAKQSADAAPQRLGAGVSPVPGKTQRASTGKDDWEPVTGVGDIVKKGMFADGSIIRDKALFGSSPANFDFGVRKSLKKMEGSLLDVSQREEVAKMLRKAKHNGLTSGEVYKGIQKLKDQGILDHREARRLRKDLGAKPSGFFG